MSWHRGAGTLLGFAALGLALAGCGQTNDVVIPNGPGSAAHDGGADATTRLGPDGGEIMTTDDADAPLSDADTTPPGTDAAKPDGGSPGITGDGGRNFSTDTTLFLGSASRCADAGVQLCEDFETGTLNTAIWSVVGSKVTIDTMQHARGSHALHITQQNDGPSYIVEKTTFPEPANTYYGRVFVYFKSLPTPPGLDYAHWTMIAASGSGVPGEIRVSGQLGSGKNIFGVGTDNRTDGGAGDFTNSDNDPKGAPVPVPLDKWLCIEWMHKGDTNETAFWWDAVSHPSLSTTASVMHGGAPQNPYLLPQFKQVWVGWQEYQTSTELFESWIDEIAIDTKRIGCVL
jgi:hypothetical protein